MSRIGRMPIAIPRGVDVTLKDQQVTVKGPMGTLTHSVHHQISCTLEDGVLTVTRPSDARTHKALHGLTRALLANMVTGVSQGYRKSLELVGVGYRVQQQGSNMVLQVGFSHPVEVLAPAGVTLTVEGNNRIHVDGIDKQQVGEIAAQLRRTRPPNRYTGKGVRYLGEEIRLRQGKAAGRKA